MCSVDSGITLGWLCLSHPRSSEMMLVISLMEEIVKFR